MKTIEKARRTWPRKTSLQVFTLLGLTLFLSRGVLFGGKFGISSAPALFVPQWILGAAIPNQEPNWWSSASAGWFVACAVTALSVFWFLFRRSRGRKYAQYGASNFSAVAEKSDNAILVLNGGGRIEWVNGGFTKATGFQPKEAIGKLPGAMLTGSNPNPAVTQNIREGLASRRNFSIEIHSRHAQGHHHWLSLNFTPVFSDKRVLTHYVVVANDITARKRAEEALSRSSRNNELILNAMNEGVCGIDVNGRVTFMNCAATRMTGWKISDIMGKPISQLLYQLRTDGMPDVEEDYFLRVAFKDGQVLVGDSDLFLRNNGNRFPVSYSTTAIYEADQLVGAVMVFRDVSDQKQSEMFRARQSRQYALRAEVGFALATGDSQKSFLRTCAQSFLKALEACCCRIWLFNPLEKTLELEAHAGLASGSVDSIRSIPLGTMKVGMIARDRVASLTNDLANDPDEIDKEWVQKEGLTSFVGLPLMLEGQLLAVVGVYARSKFPPDTIDLLNSVTDSIGQGILRKRAEIKAVEQANLLDQVSEGIVVIDLNGRVLYSNGKAGGIYGWNNQDVVGEPFDRYLPKGRGEFLRAKKELLARGEWKSRCQHQTEERSVVDVDARWNVISDPEGNPKAFGLFVELPDRELSQGLASCPAKMPRHAPWFELCHEFSEVFGVLQCQLDQVKKEPNEPGLIELVESSVRRGANILGDMKCLLSEEEEIDDALPRGHGEFILVVDDDPASLAHASGLLAEWGYRVITATDGAEAVAVYSTHRDEIALVLTDLAMPHMDGVATLRTFKQLNPQLPIVVVSDQNDLCDLKDSVHLENVDLQEKPLIADRILPCLRAALTQTPSQNSPSGPSTRAA